MAEAASIGGSICVVVQKKLTPLRKPRKRGGSPSGVSDPPIFATRKIKKTTTCTRCFLQEFALSIGLIISIAAPVVPIQLASTVPIRMRSVFRAGVPVISPLRRIPPAYSKERQEKHDKGQKLKQIGF